MKRTFPISVLLSSTPLDFESAVREAAELGFSHVDVIALVERPSQHAEVLADTGLLVGCASLGRDLPDGFTLDASSLETRRAALTVYQHQLADASRLGATHAYVVSGSDNTEEGVRRFAEACILLADFAERRRVQLCVEPIPGRALASATQVLAWLDEINHSHLKLLLDVGHCLISQEDPANIVRRAGKRLGWVHFDDNNGVDDLHWPLLTGQLTRSALAEVLRALEEVDYREALTLELKPEHGDWKENLRSSIAAMVQA